MRSEEEVEEEVEEEGDEEGEVRRARVEKRRPLNSLNDSSYARSWISLGPR